MNDIIETLRKKLDARSIHDLRQVGRAVGVNSSTDKRKEVLIDLILKIARAENINAPRSRKGARPKNKQADASLVEDVWACRAFFSQQKGETDGETSTVQVNAPAELQTMVLPSDERTVSGYLQQVDRYWFVRVIGCQISNGYDVFMHDSFIQNYGLRTGDFVTIKMQKQTEENYSQAHSLISVNGRNAEFNSQRPAFDTFTPDYPAKQIPMEDESLIVRAVDLFAPIGYGQRVLLSAPPQTGKTETLIALARAIAQNDNAAKVILVLIGSRPEEAALLKKEQGFTVITSDLDQGEQQHANTANLACEHAKRLAEEGYNAVLLIDGFTQLVRAHNVSKGRVVFDELQAQALVEPRKILSSARAGIGNGSLTVIAALTANGGSKMDDTIYEAIRPLGNAHIALSAHLAQLGVTPALDILSSATYKCELFQEERALRAARAIRAQLRQKDDVSAVMQALSQTKTNAEFSAQILK